MVYSLYKFDILGSSFSDKRSEPKIRKLKTLDDAHRKNKLDEKKSERTKFLRIEKKRYMNSMPYLRNVSKGTFNIKC